MDKLENNKRKVARSQIQVNCFAKAAQTISELHGHGYSLDEVTLMQELIDGAQRVTDGNTKELEQMLFTHAKALDYIFFDALNKLADCGMINQIETFTNIAFRAQNQSRKAILALADLRNPRRATFIKQQNNAINQQVNNTQQAETKDFENSEKVANELLRESNHETLDHRGAPETIGFNQEMETMEISRS